MLSRNTVTAGLNSGQVNLEHLFSLLESFQITRFAIRPMPGPNANSDLETEIAGFAEKMQAFALGELRVFGWPDTPLSPQRMNCWSWTSHALELVRGQFQGWLVIGEESRIHWSFFRRTNLVLDLPGNGSATFIDLLPAEIAELQMLGLKCDVIDRGFKTTQGGDPEWNKRHRTASPYFGPHVQMTHSYQKAPHPSWWTAEHDALILKQVKKDQWRWKPAVRIFIKGLSNADIGPLSDRRSRRVLGHRRIRNSNSDLCRDSKEKTGKSLNRRSGWLLSAP